MLTIVNLNKTYKEKKILKNISLRFEQGKVYGLLGKNGAGKSTLIKLIIGLKKITSGSIICESKISYLPENICLYSHLTAKENLKVISNYSGKNSKPDFDKILEEVSLHNTSKKNVADFSLGMKRRLQLAMTLYIGLQDIIILDEPTNGLDLVGLDWLRMKIKSLRSEGKTIIIASHSFKELEELITDYIIIDNGEVLSIGEWSIPNSSKNKGAIITLNAETLPQASEMLKKLNITHRFVDDMSIELLETFDYSTVVKNLAQINIFPQAIKIIETSLEEIFSETINQGKES